MKTKIKIFLAIMGLIFAGCGSDRNKNNGKDSLMTDSAVMDTSDMKAAPADTTVMRIDSLNRDTGMVTR